MSIHQVHEPIDSRVFRNVLGHFPTGVVVVTAIAREGAPVGMAVGSFTSVSLDPPLVAFLPDRASSSFPRIREADSFCVNVLASDQEPVCRAFAMKKTDKFDGIAWEHAPSGAPRIAGAVAWIDCVPHQIHEAGDHYIVLGRVTGLGVPKPTIPLLFFQGGYGAFAPQALVAGAREEMVQQIRLADQARGELQAMADDLGVETRALAAAGSQQEIVAAAQPRESGASPTSVGLRLPFMPPWNATYLAWSTPEEVDALCAQVFPPLDDARRQAFERERNEIRRHGWSLTLRDREERMSQIFGLFSDIGEYGHTPDLERRLAVAVSQMRPHANPADLDEPTAGRVLALSVPVFDRHGRVPMLLSIFDPPPKSGLAKIRAYRDRLASGAAEVTRRIGGIAPPGYGVRD